MSLLKYIVIGSSLIVLSTAAFAFQEQTTGSAPAPAAAAKVDAKPVDLASPGADDLKSTIGTEVRIPGLGKLGSLPKMDFGWNCFTARPKANSQTPLWHAKTAQAISPFAVRLNINFKQLVCAL